MARPETKRNRISSDLEAVSPMGRSTLVPQPANSWAAKFHQGQRFSFQAASIHCVFARGEYPWMQWTASGTSARRSIRQSRRNGSHEEVPNILMMSFGLFMMPKERIGPRREYRYVIKAVKSRVIEGPYVFIGVGASFTIQLVACQIRVMTTVDIVVG